MNPIRQLHRQAMELADEAYQLRRNGEYESAEQLFRRAYLLEIDSAAQTDSEPGRGILYRSAATLALHAKEYREAEKAVALGLAGEPYPEFAQELREIYEQINFHRHLRVQGVSLNPHEMQLTMVGNSISQGMALTDAVFTRIQQFEKLFIRTAQRLNGVDYGRSTRGKFYNLYMSQPRSGSFAVTLRVGEPEQQVLPGLDNRTDIIDEVIHNLDLLNESRIEDLKASIRDVQYFTSFLGIAKQIAPDGDNIRMVGVTAQRGSQETSVGLSLTQNNIKPIIDDTNQIVEQEENAQRESLSIDGELLFADSISKNNIKLRDGSGKTHTIEVSFAIAEDIVRPYFGRNVKVDVSRIGKKLYFRDIMPID